MVLRRPVAGEATVRGQDLDLRPAPCPRQHLGPRLLGGPTAHQGLGLGKEVGHQLGLVIAQRVVALDGGDEVAGIISVPWWMSWKKACWPFVPGSPQTTGPVVCSTPTPSRVDPLAVALHVRLLQVGRQVHAGTGHRAAWRGSGRRRNCRTRRPRRARMTGTFSLRSRVENDCPSSWAPTSNCRKRSMPDRQGDGDADDDQRE